MFRLLRRLVKFCYHDRILATWQKGYDAGLNLGYDLGYKMGQSNLTGRGFIIGQDLREKLGKN